MEISVVFLLLEKDKEQNLVSLFAKEVERSLKL